MNTRLLLLSADPARPATCLHLDGDGRIVSREHPTADAPASASTAPARVVVPGLEVRALWMPLSARSAAQARAEARALAAAQLAGATDDVHVAVGAGSSDQARLVAILDPALLQAWLEHARALGVEPHSVTPDHLMLAPAGDERARVLDFDSHWAVRSESLAFSAEPALARQLLGTRELERLERPEDIEHHLATATPAIDLLQGPFAKDAGSRARPRGYRRAAWLALALLLSPAVLIGAQAARHEIAARQLMAHAQQRVQQAFGLQTPVVDPAATAAERLAALRAPQRFAADAGVLFDAVAAVDGAYLAGMTYRSGTLQASVVHPQAQDLDALLATLADAGLPARASGSRPVGDGIRTQLQLTGTQPETQP